MSGDNSYSASLRENPGAAGSDHGVTQARSAGTGLAEAPPAEPMSRAEYAGFMRQRPAADGDASHEDGAGHDRVPGQGDDSASNAAGQAQGMTHGQYADHTRYEPAAAADNHARGDDHDPAGTGQPGDSSDEPRQADPAEQAQGMTRSQYAGLMRHSAAAGEDAPGFVGAGDYSNPDGDPGTSQPGSGTDVGQFQPTGRATADLGPAEQPAESLTPQAAVAENDARIHHGRIAIADLDEDGGNPAESPTRQEAADNRGHDSANTAGGPPDLTGTDLASAGPELEPQAQSGVDRTEMPAGDVVKPLSPEAEQLKVLEVENAQARQKIADLETKNDELAARLDRIEQLLASNADRRPGDASAPERGADEPGTSQRQDASRTERRSTDRETDINAAEPSRWRRVVSAENFGAAGTLLSAADTITQFAMHATPEGVVGLATTVLGLAALGLGKAEKNRKGKDDHPDQRQGGEGAA
jgi:hypothetical protein